jgi:thymidylate synthase
MNTLDKKYTDLLQDILDTGVTKMDRTGTGTLSVFGRQIRHKMSEGFPLLTTKKMAWKTMVTELLWFLRGETNIKYLVDNNCHIWDGDAYKNWVLKNSEPDQYWLTKEQFIERIKTDTEFAKKWGDLGPVYGKQWRHWKTNKNLDVKGFVVGLHMEYGFVPNPDKISHIDQIANLIHDLKTNPDSRRLMINAWNVGELGSMTLPPCHYGFQIYTRELSFDERFLILSDRDLIDSFHNLSDKKYKARLDEFNIPRRAISLMWNQRSVDTFLGLPFNIASYGLLLEIIATATNMVPDELIGNLGDTHLYLNHIDQAKEQVGRKSFELPKLNINTEWWPTESGECGVGSIDAVKVFESFKDDNFCKCLLEDDIQLGNYQSHPSIKAPLSN